jgi:hypothetical protein
MYAAFPRSDYYESSATPEHHQPTVDLPAAWLVARRVGRYPGASHVHHPPVGGVGIELYPGSITTSTPQSFLVVSRTARNERHGSGRATD